MLTAVWAEMLLGRRPAGLDEVPELCDLYLLTDVDFRTTTGHSVGCQTDNANEKTSFTAIVKGHVRF